MLALVALAPLLPSALSPGGVPHEGAPRSCGARQTGRLSSAPASGTARGLAARRCGVIASARPQDNPVLQRLERAASAAVDQSTGAGMESSGSGRAEWGTWCDEKLLRRARAALDDCAIDSRAGRWAALWEVAGGEAPSARLRVGGGERWDLVLHLFCARGEVEERACRVKYADGTLALLKPLLGAVRVSKFRADGAVLGVPKELRGGSSGLGGRKADRAFLQLGGPLQEYLAITSNAALLELVLRHETQCSTVEADLPRLEQPELRAAFEQLPPPPSPSPTPRASAKNVSAAPSPAAARQRGLENSLASSFAASLSGNVGGLEAQLEAIVRRVLASRADPAAARRLGVSHVRGILLSGPPGCGKTLLARELARSLGAREPQVVNGPEILDKYVGEAEKRVRALFAPAEEEYAAAGDASALHVIILDEMDSICKKRGSVSGDSSGVRDSVVNQLLAKMDGVVEAGNVLVVGLTNRPELLDDALLRPGRHFESSPLTAACISPTRYPQLLLLSQAGGLVRSAASFALGRAAVEACDLAAGESCMGAMVRREDLEAALLEVTPVLGKMDAEIRSRFDPYGVGSPAAASGMASAPTLAVKWPHSILLVPDGKGAGTSALAAWASSQASADFNYVRFLTAADILSDSGAADLGRSSSLAGCFAEARAMRRALLVLDDVDLMVDEAGVLLALLRAQLRMPLSQSGGMANSDGDPALLVIATSSSTSPSSPLAAAFDDICRVPLLRNNDEAADALRSARIFDGSEAVDSATLESLKLRYPVGVKQLLRTSTFALF
ncbi:hypothetical protein AB1Y20_001303 [Prymnesium parvum]|uniref:Vesicle-fusing ATPase n=1 Tax=Prymnesium parvum TaxID=97485 RepID=A0AB34KB98_PRYPA